MRISLFLLLTFALPVACGGDAGAPGASIAVYKYAGSVQCTGGGMSLAEMNGQLADAGIKVLSSACGFDGKLYVAVCGGPDGRIGIFEVMQTQMQAAAKIGFAPLSELPAAGKASCQ
jgi:hypothetical protein